MQATDNKEIKTFNINNRRYLGNKYKITNFIREIVDRECGSFTSFADIFAGTGSVASTFSDKTIIINDILYSNYVCHIAWFGTQKYNSDKLYKMIGSYNELNSIDLDDNYMSQTFSDTYFSKDDCKKIGYIREDIENQYTNGKINERERAILITSLIYAMDKVANTCGHYDAYFLKTNKFNPIVLQFPNICENNSKGNRCFNEDANQLVKKISADVFYIDPPYNSRQYGSAYHVLENVARWEKPNVSGVARKMNVDDLKSNYCGVKAADSLRDLVSNINAKYILLSYNNMGSKGNERSNARITDDEIIDILSEKGNVKVFSIGHKIFSAGKSDIPDNQERLFLCEVYDNRKTVASPLNYTGGKYKLMSQLLKYFPKNTECFLDLFCGGCNVGVNANACKIICNDNNKMLISLLTTLKDMRKEDVFNQIFNIIEKYDLSDTLKNGYEFYKCSSNSGLGNFNKDKYLKLREDFNCGNYGDFNKYIMLYVLVVFGFNNEFRFNNDGDFNLPIGKRDFNKSMQKKLSDFIDSLKSKYILFTSEDFRDCIKNNISEATFVYADPPYLITNATYNEQNSWSEMDEKDLLSSLDFLNSKGIKFALSNVLSAKGKKNDLLINWLNNNDSYRVIKIKSDYSNSNYHRKNREEPTDEVLIINY